MPDYSIKEIVLITGGVVAIREHEQPGDYEVSVLIDHAPLPGDLYRRVRALVRDRRLAVFPGSLVAKDEIDAYPLLGTVRGVHEALANNQSFGGDGGLPTGLRLEETLNLPNLYAQAPRLHPPVLPPGQKLGEPTNPKTKVRPDAPYAAYKEPSAREILESGSFAYETHDGQIHVVPAPSKEAMDPISTLIEMMRPVIEKMAEITAIPVQIVPDRTEDLKRLVGVRDVTIGGKSPVTVTEVHNEFEVKSPADLDAAMDRTHRAHRRGERFECGVKPVDDEQLQRGPGGSLDRRPTSYMRLASTVDRRDRIVQIRVTDDEFREMIVWHIRQVLFDIDLALGDVEIPQKERAAAADEAFRRIFSEIRTGQVITGRNVGNAP